MNTEPTLIANRTPSSMERSDASVANPGEKKRTRLVSLLRGYFAAPVIATIGELGISDRMLEGRFRVEDFEPTYDRRVLHALFRYLHSIGLLDICPHDEYSVSEEGRTVLTRNGAFSLLLSYAPYFDSMSDLLTGVASKPNVNRVRNVRGSGHLHARKFFPAAAKLCGFSSPSALIDVGCGDGMFLDYAGAQWPGASVFGVDLSEAAVEATQHRLSRCYGERPYACISDGHDVAAWFELLPPSVRESSELVISMWFVAHEFSHGSVDRMTRYFETLRFFFPHARVLLGEITNIPAERLALDYACSIMPEFLLFHELSGQGVLSWPQWQDIRAAIPYSLKGERRFDEVKSPNDSPIPASFLWLLEPR